MNTRKLIWLELIKATALVWIFINHTAERVFGYPYFANPGAYWPPLAERIAQLRPVDGYGILNLPVNLFRYFSWTGDQGVQLFIIASGLGLTWGLLSRQSGKPLNVGKFYLRRAERIFPLWWGAHILFIGIWFFTGWGLSLFNPETLVSMLGIRVTPGLLYYFSPAWWYIWLLIQLYLVYPLLWEGLRKLGPMKLLIWGSIIAFAIRGIGLYVFDGYLDAWSRGAIFITRLPEFIFGISLASWMFSNPDNAQQRIKAPLVWAMAAVVYLSGLLLSFSLAGMIFAPFLQGVGAFTFLFLFFDRLTPTIPRWALAPGLWVGDHSYSLYLVHHPVILALIPVGMSLSIAGVGRFLLSFVLTVILALILEWTVNGVVEIIRRLVKRIGVWRTVSAALIMGAAAAVLLIGSELVVRRLNPQEVLGWGERPSLQPDPVLGWRMKPSQSFHLRWQSYNYKVYSNSLGFPAPDYPQDKPEGVFRIFVTGDAFSSAEGVDTGDAWPRLLEAYLKDEIGTNKVEVLNFSITGYGPNQYAAVVNEYAPLFDPDLIIVELFVNDFQDVLWSNEDFQNSIGFNLGNQEGIVSIIRLEHLRRWLELNLFEPVKEAVRGQPQELGYFLGNFYALERDNPEVETAGRDLVSERLSQIQLVTDQIGARMLLIMIPASVQVCQPDQLAYFPKSVDINDGNLYDDELPQRMMSEIARKLELPLSDLRKPLMGLEGECYYQPRNMHWTASGHEVIAEYLTDLLIKEGYIPQ